LSENLRLELAPLGIKVITLVAGNTTSNIATNAPPPSALPSSSPYLPIEKSIAIQAEYSDMPTEQFAEKLVETVMSRGSGAVWIGSNTTLVRYAMPLMPQWMFVSFP
jgi:1-acylglycerone phosphate reductase